MPMQERAQSRWHANRTSSADTLRKKAQRLMDGVGMGFEQAMNVVRTADGLETMPPFLGHLEAAKRKAAKDRTSKVKDPALAAFYSAVDLGTITQYEDALRYAVNQRCATPTDELKSDEVWLAQLEGDAKLVWDIPLLLFVWSTLGRRDARWYGDRGQPEQAMATEGVRRWFLVNYAEYGMLLPAARAHQRLLQGYRRVLTFAEMKPHFQKTLADLVSATSLGAPVDPSYMVGWCPETTAGRGCHCDTKHGVPSDFKRHGCFMCRRNDKPEWRSHGWVDCPFHRSFFLTVGMGHGTIVKKEKQPPPKTPIPTQHYGTPTATTKPATTTKRRRGGKGKTKKGGQQPQ